MQITLSKNEILRLAALGRVHGIHWRQALTKTIEDATEEEAEAIEEESAAILAARKAKWEKLKAKGRVLGAGKRRGRKASERADHPADAKSPGPTSRRGAARRRGRAGKEDAGKEDAGKESK